jgi:hypothetical protein
MRGRDTSSRAGQKHTGKTNATEIQWQIVHKQHMNNLGGRNFFSEATLFLLYSIYPG